MVEILAPAIQTRIKKIRTTMKRTGGIAKPGIGTKHISDGIVNTHPKVADYIFKFLEDQGWIKNVYAHHGPEILDACGGSGVLGNALKKILSRDIIWRGSLTHQDIAISGKSICDEIKPPREFDFIVCNPPWKESVATEIYFHLLSLLKEGGTLFFLINLVWLYQGPERAQRIKCDKFYFLPRYAFKWSGRPMLDCGILVFRNDGLEKGHSSFIHIPKDIHTLELEKSQDLK